MSATVVAAESPAPPRTGKKKLLLIIAAAVLALLLIGAGGVWLIKSRTAADADAGDEEASAAQAATRHEAKRAPPVYLPLDAFTVNLADKDSERYAQIAVTLELEDPKFGDQIKLYLPAIRHNILMTLAQKTSAELLTREGKELLARQIRRDALRPMGIELPDPAADGDGGDEAPARKQAKRKKTAAATYPVRSVQFASFIVQ